MPVDGGVGVGGGLLDAVDRGAPSVLAEAAGARRRRRLAPASAVTDAAGALDSVSGSIGMDYPFPSSSAFATMSRMMPMAARLA